MICLTSVSAIWKQQFTERQILRRAHALVKRTNPLTPRKPTAAAKRAKKKPVVPDGLTPEEQLAVAFDEKFQKAMKHVARAIVRDPMEEGHGTEAHR